MKLVQVQWWDIPQVWPAVEPWIGAALAHGGGGYWLEDIYAGLLGRQMKLWLVKNGATAKACAITQLWNQPRLKVCDILAVGGRDLASWEHLIGEIEAWAASMGCDETRAHGRLGWKRQAARYGYEPLHMVYRKVLE